MSEWYQIKFKDVTPHIIEYYLSKNLAGSSRKVSGDEFIAWAEATKAPNDEVRTLIYEALGGLNGMDLMYVFLDGRTHPDNIAKLAVDCGLDDFYIWNNYLRSYHPTLDIHPRKEDWDFLDKIAMVNWNYEGYVN